MEEFAGCIQGYLFLISSLYVCMVIFKLKYNFVETPRKFIIAELSIRKLGSFFVVSIIYFFQCIFTVYLVANFSIFLSLS